jgi:GTP cyclohydrolase III
MLGKAQSSRRHERLILHERERERESVAVSLLKLNASTNQF